MSRNPRRRPSLCLRPLMHSNRSGREGAGMKVLTLLRHAKSSWDHPAVRDFDRPLNKRGRKAARTIGHELQAQGLAFDAVLASPAKRVVETVAELAGGYGQALNPEFDDRIYMASAASLLSGGRAASDDFAAVFSGAGAKIEQLISAFDHLAIVFHHEQSVP